MTVANSKGIVFQSVATRPPEGDEPQVPKVASIAPFYVAVASSIEQIGEAEWNELVPRDAPHLRYGFLRAVEVSKQNTSPHYVLVRARKSDKAVAVAAAYRMPVDLLTLVPRRYTRWLDTLRARFAPNLLRLGTLTCGPIVTNCHPSLFLSPALSDPDYDAVASLLIHSLESMAGKNTQLHLFFEFAEPAAGRLAPVMLQQGYIKALSLPGTRMDVRWNSLEEYTGLLRKAFRRTVRKDRTLAEGLSFDIVDDFAPYADDAWQLYRNVSEKAEFVFEELTPAFFRALAQFEQSRMVIAREKATGKLVGMELLLCGDTILQDIYTGVDYEYNREKHLYFNLLYPVIDYAGQRGFKQMSLGQTSYTFKSRLGVTPYSTYLFVKHRNRVVHRIIKSLKSALFPETATYTHRVFRNDGDGAPSEPEGA